MKNDYEVKGDVTTIVCNHRGCDWEVVIDTEDLPRLCGNKYGKWGIRIPQKDRQYVQAVELGRGGFRVQLHRVIMNAPHGSVVLHKNGDMMDNRKENLEIIDRSSFSIEGRKGYERSKSGEPGIRWHNRDKRWEVRIYIGGKRTTVGSSVDLHEAIKIRDNAIEKYRR